jgi:hypothetical protein
MQYNPRPNKSLQQTGQANPGSSWVNGVARVSRLLSWVVRYHVGSEVSGVVQVSVR